MSKKKAAPLVALQTACTLLYLIAAAMTSAAERVADGPSPTKLERPQRIIQDGVIYLRSASAGAVPALRTGQQTQFRRGQVLKPGGRPVGADMIAEWDVPIRLRDGTVIYADLFRPAESTKTPVIIAWSPYGKSGGEAMLNHSAARHGVSELATSGLQKFEGPDPAYWCAHGYAILNTDNRGAGNSGGNILYWGPSDSRDGYDVVEWAGTQEWSNGKVAFSGNSWLAIAQWFIASEHPPHLAAIAPWEGLSDLYRDSLAWGGIPDVAFNARLTAQLVGQNYTEFPSEMLKAHPIYNAYWREKTANLKRIELPAYVVASWTNGLHVNGTFRGWSEISSAKKWLRVHNTHEWTDLYEYETDLKKFFDHYLKGIANEWEQTPKVRLSILDPGGTDTVNKALADFPLPGTRYRRLYLDATSNSLSATTVSHVGSVSYDSGAPGGRADFTVRIDRRMELAGYLLLNAWVQSPSSDDMDLYVYVQKVDGSGKLIEPIVDYFVWPGQQGRLRVSHRSDSRQEDNAIPSIALRHDRERRLSRGEIVQVQVPIQPLGMRWSAGEYLRVVVTGQAIGNSAGLSELNPDSRNKGMHVIHTGGHTQSYLLIPDVTDSD